MARDLLSPLAGGTTGGWSDADIQSILSHFLDLSLIQFHAAGTTAPWYTLHSVVREYLLNPLPAAQRHDLHLRRAAAYYGTPFVEEARRFIAESGQTRTEEQIAALARSNRGVVGQWVHQTEDMDRAHWAMERALSWQHHLFQAEQVDAAGEIVMAIHDVLARWGQRDAAKALLRRSIDTLEDAFGRAVAQGNLATLLKDEGRLAEALQVYEEVYQTFAVMEAKQQMAAVLSLMSIIYQHMGDLDRAIDKQQASLQIEREIEDEEGQAISLHQLSLLYMLKEDYDAALTHSQQAEALTRKVGNEALVAATLQEQGLIFTLTNREQDAFQRFSESLKIMRRIGGESGVANSLNELGKLYRNAEMMREAIAAFNEALEIFQQQGDPKMGITLALLGTVHYQQGEYTAALEKFEQALRIFQQAGMASYVKEAQQSIARVRGKMGK